MVRQTKGRVRKRLPSHEKARRDAGSWLTRAQAAQMLHVSQTTIINWQNNGRIHPQQALRPDRSGIDRVQYIYDPEELVGIRPLRRSTNPRDPGELAAQAFEAFGQRMSMREIVIALRVDPATLEHLHEQWLDLGGADLVINDAMKAGLEKLVGEFSTLVELLELVEKLHAAAAKASAAQTR